MLQILPFIRHTIKAIKLPKKTMIGGIAILIIVATFFYYQYAQFNTMIGSLEERKSTLETQLLATKGELDILKKQDQYVINKNLEGEIANIQKTYNKAVVTYENLLKLQDLPAARLPAGQGRQGSQSIEKLEELLASSLVMLSKRNYASAEAALTTINAEIDKEKEKIASTFSIPKNVPTDNTPPAGGFSRQQVQIDIGTYLVDIVSADLGSTRVIVDTASESDCHDNCPVLSLGDYVARNGAFAGVNGSYFCPAEYPSCAGKTNSYDTLLMNKNKKHFNADNNVYSTVPAVIFLGGSVRYVGQSLEWGRDTGIDSMIANQPLLLSGGNIVFGGSGDPKQGSKGSRSFVGSKGNTIYIGVVHNATVAEVAHVLKALGLEGALNLDSGGSTALWHGGYKVGPGRAIPNAVLFVNK
ncbi:MAG: phosphodiester glycosidase family protein [Candidatus Levybacteria bacterium]|nr:phosphodiester glycosidase family protein [Candidatus Levybacteria bacterium]